MFGDFAIGGAFTEEQVLKQGTEKTYTAAAFNHDGSQLATVREIFLRY